MYSVSRIANTLGKGLIRTYHHGVKSFQGTYPQLAQTIKEQPVYHHSFDTFQASNQYKQLKTVMKMGQVPKYAHFNIHLQSGQEVLSKLPETRVGLTESVLDNDVFIGLHGTDLYAYLYQDRAEGTHLKNEKKPHHRPGRDGHFHIVTGSPYALEGALHYAKKNVDYRDTSAYQYLFRQSYLAEAERDREKEAHALSLLNDTHLPEAVILLVMYRSPDVSLTNYNDLLIQFKEQSVALHPLKLHNNPERAHICLNFDTEVVVPPDAIRFFKTIPLAVIGGKNRVDFNTQSPTSLSTKRFFAWPSISVREGDSQERVFKPDKGFIPPDSPSINLK